MKKLLSIFTTFNLISISSSHLIACNEAGKKEVVENKQNEDKDKDDNSDNTHETKPLTTQQIADQLVRKFEDKKRHS